MRRGEAGQSSRGLVSLILAGLGEVRQARHGLAWTGMVTSGRQGGVRLGTTRRGSAGTAWIGEVSLGAVRQARFGGATQGTAGQAWPG